MVTFIEMCNNVPEADAKLEFNGVEIKSPIPDAIHRATLNLGDRLVVIFNYPGSSFKDLPTANVFAFDQTGRVIWTVEPYAPYVDLAKDHYIHFGYDKETSQVILGTFIGHRAFLDTTNGAITPIDIGRPW